MTPEERSESNRKRVAEWRAKNRDKQLEQGRQQAKRRRENNPEANREAQKRWRDRHPDKVKAARQRAYEQSPQGRAMAELRANGLHHHREMLQISNCIVHHQALADDYLHDDNVRLGVTYEMLYPLHTLR